MKLFRCSQRLYWVCHCVVWFVIKQTPLRVRLLAGRESIFLTFAARSTIIYFGKDQGSCELRVAATHARDVWAMWAAGERPFDELFSSYRRKSFTTIMHKVYFWRLKWSQLLRKCVSQNKAKNAGRSRKNAGMLEIHQNAGFPARLRDGWHLLVGETGHAFCNCDLHGV